MPASSIHFLMCRYFIDVLRAECAPDLNLLNLCTSKDASGAKEQDYNEQREGNGVPVSGKSRAPDECFHHTEHDSAHGSARNISDSTEHCGDERFDTGQKTHKRIDRWITERKQDSACAGESAA